MCHTFILACAHRSAIKCEKDEKAERLKVKKAIEKNNMEGAKICAEVCAGAKNVCVRAAPRTAARRLLWRPALTGPCAHTRPTPSAPQNAIRGRQ